MNVVLGNIRGYYYYCSRIQSMTSNMEGDISQTWIQTTSTIIVKVYLASVRVSEAFSYSFDLLLCASRNETKNNTRINVWVEKFPIISLRVGDRRRRVRAGHLSRRPMPPPYPTTRPLPAPPHQAALRSASLGHVAPCDRWMADALIMLPVVQS